MNSSFLETRPELFPLFFIGIWFAATTLTGLLSGWYSLMREFPDREETEWLRLKNLTGTMGITHMRSVLHIAVCPSGLRICMMRVFGPFCRSFFVPWEQIQVEREQQLFRGKTAKLRFGNRLSASLGLPADVMDRLARASQGKWPEAGSFPVEDKSEVRRTILTQWAAATAVASLFFMVMPRLIIPGQVDFPPIPVAILFPAIVFGLGSFVRYRRRIGVAK